MTLKTKIEETQAKKLDEAIQKQKRGTHYRALTYKGGK